MWRTSVTVKPVRQQNGEKRIYKVISLWMAKFKESTSQYRALVGFYMYIVSFYVFCFKATHPDAQWGDPRAEAGLAPTQQPHHDQRRVLQDADVQGHR